VPLHREAGRFLRLAVKTGLRLQRTGPGESGKETGAGVQTLQRIKASLRKRTSNPRKNQ